MKNSRKILCLIFAALLLSESISASKAEVPLDFDGDGKTDPTVWRIDPATPQIIWFSLRSRDGFFAFPWGAAQLSSGFEDKLVPEDYDGDGKWDVAVWRRRIFEEGQSYFYIFYSSTNTYQVIPWGLRYDDPIPQDYDGDGRADLAVFRPSDGTWYISQSRDGFRAERWGSVNDYTVRGDYDGDGRADLAVCRRDEQTFRRDYIFYIRRSSDGGLIAEKFGYAQADFITPGDYDGDGKTDIAVWRGDSEYGNGTWYWHRSSDGKFAQLRWGTTFTPDYPAPGDYDGDGTTDTAVYRRGGDSCYSQPQPSYFFINGSRNGWMAIQWGNSCFEAVNR